MRRAHIGTTVIATRGLETMALSNEVAALLPTASRRARRRISPMERAGTIRTTFCPLCGGNKYRTSVVCRACHLDATHRGHDEAKAAGRRSSGWSNGARALVTDQIASHGDERAQNRGMTRHHGDGLVRPNRPWVRRVLVDGIWIEKGEDDD